MKVATCSIVKLENNYLLEFVEHYKNIGFDHMFIYDNNREEDEHPEEVLQKYIDDGFVSIINYRNQEKYPMNDALRDAFTECWENNKNEYDWILFVDNDEFLQFSKDNNVKKYLSREEINKCDLIKINWKCYDDNDLIYYEDKPLKERFTRCCNNDPYLFEENKHIKTFIHNTAKNHKIIWDKEKSAAHAPELDSVADLITGDNCGTIVTYETQLQYCLNYINYDLCWLDHYRMKTIDEYINNKIVKLTKQGYFNIAFSSYKFFEYNKYTEEKEKLYLEQISKHTRNCVYTCIMGDYDELHDPTYITEGWAYICFTNNHNLKSDIWTIVYLNDSINDFIEHWLEGQHLEKINQYMNRWVKLFPHIFLRGHDFSIYVDGNITITGDLNDFKSKYIDKVGSYKYIMYALEHYRDCLYDEIDACIKQNKDYIENLNNLKQFYIDNNYPHHNGLTHNCIIARYHFDQKCIRLMQKWWDMVNNYTVRDQCSLMYIVNENNLKENIGIIKNDEINQYVNYYESYGKHKKQKVQYYIK